MYNATKAYTGEIRVSGRPVKKLRHNGRTYIEGRKGTEYTLFFKNDTNQHVLVIPSVDGLSVIDGKPAGKSSPGFIVDAYSSIDIPGWKVDGSTAAKFTFWPQDARGEATYVEELSKSGANVDIGNQGLIGFMVIAERENYPILRATLDQSPMRGIKSYSDNMPMWSSNSSTMDDIVQLSASASVTEPTIGTKFGGATDFKTTSSTFNRGAVVDELVLEYDTLRGLKDRGVPTELFKGKNKNYESRTAFPAEQNGCVPPKRWKASSNDKSNIKEDAIKFGIELYKLVDKKYHTKKFFAEQISKRFDYRPRGSMWAALGISWEDYLALIEMGDFV